MPTARSQLGQINPAAAADGTLFTVPAVTDYVVSSIVIAETGGAAATIKISSNSAGGATTTAAKAIAWNLPIGAASVTTLTLGITLQAAATIVCQSSTGNVTFTAYGQANT